MKSPRLCGPVQEALGGISEMECSPTNALPLELKGVSRAVGVSGGSGRVFGQWACLWAVGVSARSRALEDREQRAEHHSSCHRGSAGLPTPGHLCVSAQAKQSGPLGEGACGTAAGRGLCVCPHAAASSWAWSAAPAGMHVSHSLFAFYAHRLFIWLRGTFRRALFS